MRLYASVAIVFLMSVSGCANPNWRPSPTTAARVSLPATDERIAEVPNTTETAESLEGVLPVAYQSQSDSRAVYTLEDLENLALTNNPTIAELVATTQKAAGFRTQVELRANPTVGYSGTQTISENSDEHLIFISQTLITANKRALNRQVVNEALRVQLFQLEAQKYRVATDVRVRFYDALTSQRRVALVGEFLSVVDKGVELAKVRERSNEGSQLEVVQAEQQQAETVLLLEQAEASYRAAWRELTALVGCPELPLGDLSGQLPHSGEELDWDALGDATIAESPEYLVALSQLSQAQANYQRHSVQAVPNLNFHLASGVDKSTDAGVIDFEVGAPIPVFNRNQGNIAAARAEIARASREVERIEQSVKARLASVSRDYNVNLAAVNKYQARILPSSQKALELAEIAYQSGETSFVQVLIARSAYFNTNLQYLAAQEILAQSQSRIDGYVLSGGLDPVSDNSGDDSLRGLNFSQQ